MLIDKRCGQCGGPNIVKDAYAEWDKDAQEWVLKSVYDYTYCENCDVRTVTVDLLINTEGVINNEHTDPGT